MAKDEGGDLGDLSYATSIPVFSISLGVDLS